MNAMPNKPRMKAEEFALLGGGEIAYVREISAEQAHEMVDGLPENMPVDIRLFGVYAADGTCMAITDSQESALASVWENDLHATAVH